MMRLVPLLLLLLLAGCTTPGYRGLWQPKPVQLLVTGADGAPAANLLVAVLGQWRGAEHDGELHVRFSLENVGSQPLRLPAERVELRSGDLLSFGRPYVLGGGGDAQVAPGESALLDLAFLPPDEDADIRGLHLRWVLLVGAHELPGTATFQREAAAYDAPYRPWYGGVYVGGSYGWSSGWHGHWHGH